LSPGGPLDCGLKIGGQVDVDCSRRGGLVSPGGGRAALAYAVDARPEDLVQQVAGHRSLAHSSGSGDVVR